MSQSKYIHMLRAETPQMDIQTYVGYVERRAAQEAQLAELYRVQRYEIAITGIACGLLALHWLTRRRG